jgi:hypothetical protein
MKYGKLSVVAVLLSITAPVYAGVDVRIGVPLPVVVVPAPVVVAPQVVVDPVQVNVDVPAPLVLAEPPQLIFSPTLGYYVAVGIPQDVVLIDNVYYMHRGGRWFMSDRYNGNWAFVDRGRLPGGLRGHDWNYIRGFRDREYRNYRRDPGHYRGKFYDHRGGDHRPGARPGEHRPGARPGEHRPGARPGDHRPGAGPGHVNRPAQGNKPAPHGGPDKGHEGGHNK